METKVIVDFESLKHGVELLEKLLEVLPDECTRQEAMDNIEEAIHSIRESIQDEA